MNYAITKLGVVAQGSPRALLSQVVSIKGLDDAMAYRIGYSYIRQLALILRSFSTAVSQAAGGHKADKKKKAQERNAKSLVELSDPGSWLRAVLVWDFQMATSQRRVSRTLRVPKWHPKDPSILKVPLRCLSIQ